MYITVDVIIKIAAVLTALITIGTAAWAVIKWVLKQDKQTADIEELKREHSSVF